jgi:hypothetical protein
MHGKKQRGNHRDEHRRPQPPQHTEDQQTVQRMNHDIHHAEPAWLKAIQRMIAMQCGIRQRPQQHVRSQISVQARLQRP